MKKVTAILSLFILFFFSCGKDQSAAISFDSAVSLTNDTTAAISIVANIDRKGHVGYMGVLLSLGKFPDTANIFFDRNYEEVDIYGKTYACGGKTSEPSYQLVVEHLNDNSWYYYKPYCIFNGKSHYGEVDSFKTACPESFVCGPAGGYVIYDDGNGGGIEVLAFDLHEGSFDPYELLYDLEWGCMGTSITTSGAVETGQTNTAAIIMGCPESDNAANKCDQYSFQGFDDWYLPSYGELSLMYTVLAAQGKGNFTQNWYWSSTEYDATTAQVVGFSSGSTFNFNKNTSHKVRPVRTF